MAAERNKTGLLILIAAAIVSTVLGTVHGFSVFLEPLEAKFQASRSQVSLTYSAALVAITLAVLGGHRFYGRSSAAVFVICATHLAALGAILAGIAPDIWLVWVGYSLIFGTANGLGYGFSLQIAAQAQPGRESWAMGVVTAAYALGALIAPAAFVRSMALGGFTGAMIVLAAVLAISGLVAGRLMQQADARFKSAPDPREISAKLTQRVTTLWVGYGAGVAAGLMTIGHAAGISRSFAPDAAVWIAPAVVAVCNLAGSLGAGWIGVRYPPGRLLVFLPAISGAAALALIGFGEAALYPALGLIGLAYGGIIAACPAFVAVRYGMGQGPAIYGRVFTAWGVAGLAAPVAAAALYDAYSSYLPSLWMVVGLTVIAAVFALKSAWSD